ncbi:Integrator complex subunit 1 [Holothuria leucospilota]|uniref:Integrator complex subunit 1 n=1 Tax=Holothuria leucospilota TaxID=206669 RepID=A0A9Q1C335_HOLLE|nr:Integrator complex subunit 1 [Holothuria leucospilota]
MDRNKPPTKGARRGMPAGEMIALGPKRRPESTGEVIRSSTPPVSSAERKRDAPSGLPSSAGTMPKKPKLTSPTPLGKPSLEFPKSSKPSQGSTSSISVARPAPRNLEVPPRDLVEKVLEADAKEDDKLIDVLLCGALQSLKTSRAKPDPSLFLGLMYLAKTKPMLFETETVVEAVCSLLRRDVSVSFKSKGNPLVAILACNILMHAFLYEENWPEIFVKVYVEDAVAERVWVDHPKNQEFVNNIITAFGTKPIPKHLSVMVDPAKSATTPTEGGGSPSRQQEDMDVVPTSSLGLEEGTDSPTENITNRFTLIKERIETYIVSNLRDQLTRRQAMDIPRSLLRLLTTACGLIEVRLMAAQKLELWLEKPKLTRPAQELLLSLCVNCTTHTPKDVEIICQLFKMRVKTKPLINHYLLAIRELLAQHPEYLSTFLKHLIYNELSTSRNPNNMALLTAIFQHSPERAAKVLASSFQTLLMKRDDYVRAVRALFREIVKTLRYDINFPTFCLSLMQERSETQFVELDPALKERYLKSVVDILCLTSLLSVTPQVREAVNAYTRGDHKDLEVIRKFQRQSSLIQRDCVWWSHTVVPEMFPMAQKDFQDQLQKLLFMKPVEAYCSKDNWPPEGDRSLLMSLLSEVPVEEDSLIRILIMGLTREIHLNPGDAIDLVDKMVKRAAVLHTDDTDSFPVLKIERLELIDALLNCCSYHYPENISLPEGYKPPSLAIVNLYWKNWVILLILAAFNPQNIGKTGWQHYPTLRCMMEMVMTNNFTFPPASLAPTEAVLEEFRNSERQMNQLEKEEIIHFENHLASVSITERNSLLLAQLIHMNPSGPARRPPVQVLEQLQQLNKVLKLGHMFCKSRDPDFLLDIIHQQGTSQSMSWLSELVNSSDTSLDMLPVQCLCEFLMNAEPKSSEDGGTTSTDAESEEKQMEKQAQLCSRIQTILYNPDGKAETTCEILEYFLKKLVLVQPGLRARSLEVLAMVISRPASDDETPLKDPNAPSHLLESHSWLLRNVPTLPNFVAAKSLIGVSLRKAMQVETDPATVSAYAAYLAHHINPTELSDLVQDLAQLIVERLTLLTFLLPRCGYKSPVTDCNLSNMLDIFCSYFQRATSSQSEGYSWSDTQDQVFLQWESGLSATMHILVVHAMVILLTYGPPEDSRNFDVLLSSWFPDAGPTPSAYLVDTSEEALLFPDWLKLRMIRSSVPKLVDAALQDLEPAQLVLFVQSFGIPVQSVSKLLAHLDAAVDQMPSALEQAVASKAYMARLVEVQQMRGATGGSRFKKLLLPDQPPTELDKADGETSSKPVAVDTEMKEVESSVKKDAEWTREVCHTHLRKVFVESNITQSERLKMSRMIQKSIVMDQSKRLQSSSKEGSGGIFMWVVKTLYDFVMNDDDRASMISVINKNTSLVSGLLRVIFNQGVKTRSSNAPILYKVICALQDTHCIRDATLNKLLKQYSNRMYELNPEIRNGSSREMEAEDIPILDQQDLHHLLLVHPESLFLQETKTSEESIYPLTLLTHQTDWRVLQNCIHQLLGKDIHRYSASTVLDFLWACLHNPKTWQGRDTRASKRHGEEDILELSPQQSCQIAAYMVMEASGMPSSSQDENSILSKMQQRLGLLIRCCSDNQDALKTVVEFLNERMNLDSPESKWYRMLLTEFYLQIPEIIHHLPNIPSQILSSEHSSLPSGIDSFTHRLLTLLASDVSSVAGRQRKLDALAALRTLASSHPTLLMRQLPLLAVLLSGRTHLNLKDFKSKGHLQFFNHVLTILHLLQPHLYKANPQDLTAIFKSYFDLLQHYGLTKSVLDFIVTKFVELLCQYYQANSSEAKTVLHSYINALNTISQSRSDLPALKSLIASLSLAEETKDPVDEGPKRSSTPGSLPFAEEIPGVGGREETASPIPGILQSDVKPMTQDEINKFQERLQKDNDPEDITDTLNELDSRCIGKTEFLLHFMTELSSLMLAPEEECRVRAFALAIRLCKHQPSASSCFLSSFLEVLDSSDGTIVESALTHLPEFCLLCQGHAPLLLKKAFSRGLKSNLDTAPAISETMQLMNMEAASVSAT